MSSGRPTPVVYVANADSREILVLGMNAESGELAPRERVPVSGTVMPLAVSPDRRFLHASLRSAPFSIASFAIDRSSGGLTHLSTMGVPDQMCYLATDRSGRFLLSASYQGSIIAIYSIGPSGAVEAQPVQLVPTRPHAHAILTDPSNRFLFASNLGGDILMQQNSMPPPAGSRRMRRPRSPRRAARGRATSCFIPTIAGSTC